MNYCENFEGLNGLVQNIAGFNREQLKAVKRIASEYLKEKDLHAKQEKISKPKLTAKDLDWAIRELNQIRKLKLARVNKASEKQAINARINAKIAKLESEYNNQDYQTSKDSKNVVTSGKIGNAKKAKISKKIKTVKKTKSFVHEYNDLHDYQNDFDDLTACSWLDISEC